MAQESLKVIFSGASGTTSDKTRLRGFESLRQFQETWRGLASQEPISVPYLIPMDSTPVDFNQKTILHVRRVVGFLSDFPGGIQIHECYVQRKPQYLIDL